MTRHIHQWLSAAVAIVVTFAAPAESLVTPVRYPLLLVNRLTRPGSARGSRGSCVLAVNRARQRAEVLCVTRRLRQLRRAELARTSDGTRLAAFSIGGTRFT